MLNLATVLQSPGTFSVLCDDMRGYIRLNLMGFVSQEESQACYTTLAQAWADARQRHGRILFLVNASEAQVQAPALIHEMTGSNPLPVLRNDRIAFVVSSSLLKMQFKREVGKSAAEIRFFLSVHAAGTWLLAPEEDPCSVDNVSGSLPRSFE
jgi:hypothetical protein